MYINIAKVDFCLCKAIYYHNEYLTLSALADGEITIMIPHIVDQNCATSISYSKDKSNWTETVVDNTEQTITIPVSNGDNVYLKGVARTWYNDGGGAHIDSNVGINVSGNIMSLLYADDFKGKKALPEESRYTFVELFSYAAYIINAKNLILPATALNEACYIAMFSGCTSLTTAPELPATTLAESCYAYMFARCTSLTTAPELPATTLAKSCYDNMFVGCTSLTTAPELPATTLAINCYNTMFFGCKKLNSITMLATDISAADCLHNWVNDVASTGTFTKAASMTSLPTGASGIPTGWTVVDYIAA